MPEKHLSTQFDSDLNALSSRVMELGGLVESQIRMGCTRWRTSTPRPPTR